MSIRKLRTFSMSSNRVQFCTKDIPCLGGAIDSGCDVSDAACFGIGVVDGPCGGGVSDKPCGVFYVSDQCNPLTQQDMRGCSGAFLNDSEPEPHQE